MSREFERPDPDLLLAKIKAQEEPQRGSLRIWLGAAPGVGKTYAMLQEAHQWKARGTDVVIGFVEPHGGWEEFLYGSVTNDILRNFKGIDVHVIGDQSRKHI